MMENLKFVFLGVIVGSIGYLTLILIGFVEEFREGRAKLEQSLIDLERLEDQLKESEPSRTEAESRTAKFAEEALLLEQQASEIQQNINDAIPTRSGSAESTPSNS